MVSVKTCIGFFSIMLSVGMIILSTQIFNLQYYIKTQCKITEYDIKSYDCYYCNSKKCGIHYICYSGAIVLNYTIDNNMLSKNYMIYPKPGDGFARYYKFHDDPDVILKKLQIKYKINDDTSCYYWEKNFNDVHLHKPINAIFTFIIVMCVIAIIIGICLIILDIKTICGCDKRTDSFINPDTKTIPNKVEISDTNTDENLQSLV